MADRFAHLTGSQRRAITTRGHSILVSAAAGSGKTTVLAERCAALVCDGPVDQRCGIDELLVVTFTDAAAGEMKSRIAAAIRKRMDEKPGAARDARLSEQLYMLDGASISTIHSFCRSVIQRWFPQAGIDPQAAVLAGQEAQLLREEVLDAFFADLYAGSDEFSLAFQQLIDDYSAGNDAAMAATVLHLHNYVSSLPDPDPWLQRAIDRLDAASADGIAARIDDLQRERLEHELHLQIDSVRAAAATIRRCWPIAAMHADSLDELRDRIEGWLGDLTAGPAASWSAVAAEIRDADMKWNTRRPTDLSDEDKLVFDAAKALRDRAGEIFERRVRQACCLFTADEYRDGLQHVAPYTGTLVELVRQFDRHYRRAKDAQAVVDFNDLQRCTLRVLADDHGRPTDAARHLQRQYRHVLVDEFQDVDPLQEAILRLVSRESADPPEGNLFTVGDIKQSIYRFRLAEPDLFTSRADRFAPSPPALTPPGGELIHLRENFRSRDAIIDAVNLIFRPLMSRSFGGSEYDHDAELAAAATFAPDAGGPMFDRPAVELHLLEPITQTTARSDDEDDDASASPPHAPQEELEGIEREAYLIATGIQQWMGHTSGCTRMCVSGRPATPDGPPQARPIEYRDIVILLRSTPHKAAPMADILRRMGIPARVDRDDGGLDGTEFNDVISLLQILDNRQQDIPLAAVLRSPIMGDRFNETQLLEIRLFNQDIPFHQAVVEYADKGSDIDLCERLSGALARIARYRRRMQQAPVAEVLWEIYSETAYLAYVCGLPDGLRRRQNLIRLHDLAREFGQFSRQGLRRFLRFVEDVRESESLSLGPTSAGPEENVVRIMTIHASKGLEFPVVILADLQKAFNLTDTRSTVLLDRELGIALRAADAERRILYPTLLHQLAAESGTRESLSEELRVLYVALTRAREHLLLVGRTRLDRLDIHRTLHAAGGEHPRCIPALQLRTAQSPLDWLLPALSTMPAGAVRWPGQAPPAARPLFELYTYDRATTDAWQLPPPERPEQAGALFAIARLQPLPPEEPVHAPPAPPPPPRKPRLAPAPSAASLAPKPASDTILAALGGLYPHLELTTVPARRAVTDLKRRWDPQSDPLERPARSLPPRITYPQPRTLIEPAALDSAGRGTATHRFLQLLDLTRTSSLTDLQTQLDALTDAGRFTPAEARAVLIDACHWFFQTDLGRRLRTSAARVRREVPFVSRISPSEHDATLAPHDSRDVILVRGMIDVLLDTTDALEILDYKTDAVEGDACLERAALYGPQIDAYAAAMEAIADRAIAHRWLVFLHGRRIIDTGDLTS